MAKGPLGGRLPALLLLTAVELMVFLDVSIVNIALPDMATALSLSAAGLAWVVNAYQLTFGGFQLVGGRAADQIGRRRIFQLGVAIFTVASLLAGLAPRPWVLIVARGLQGVGAAIVVPAEIALLSVTFTEPAAYRRAFGVWSAMGAAGAASGVALGGIITQEAGWSWIFLINVPIGVAALALSGRLLPKDTPSAQTKKNGPQRGRLARLDLPGAVTGTIALMLVVYALGEASGRGFDDGLVIGSGLAGLALFALFIVLERTTPTPLLPLRIFRIANVTGSAVANFLVGASHVPAFLFLSLYFQDVLHYSAITAGFGVLPIALVNIAVSRTVVPKVLKRYGPRMLLGAGFALLVVGLGALGRAPVGGNYVIDVLPACLIFAVGLPAIFVGSTLPAVKSVVEADTGIASGTVNTAQRIGSGVGVTVLTALGTWRSAHTHGTGPHTLNAGYQWAFLGAAGFAAMGVLAAALLFTRLPDETTSTGQDSKNGPPDRPEKSPPV